MIKRSTQVLLISTVLVLAAGVVLGRLSTSLPPNSPPPSPHKQPPWMAELALTPDQQKQMDAIWGETRKQMDANRESMDRHHQELRQQRDDAIRKLLSPEQQSAFDKVYEDYNAKRSELDKQRDSLIHGAEDRCRAMLNDSQKSKWDGLTKEMHNHRGGPHGPGDGRGGPDGRGDGKGGNRGPSSQRSEPPM